MTYPMSIGRMDWETPLGRTKIISKVRNPAWYVPASVRAEHAADGDPLPRIVPAGPNNPLGAHALRLGLPAVTADRAWAELQTDVEVQLIR